MTRSLAYLCLALSMALVGSYVALSKSLLLVFPVFLLALLRFGMGAVAMLPWLKKPADEAPLNRATCWLLFWESFLGNFLFSICMLYGMSLTSSVSAGVIMASIPACVALLSWVFLREPIPASVWLGVACAVLGIALVSLSKSELLAHILRSFSVDLPLENKLKTSSESHLSAVLGNLLIFAAVLCEAAYAVIGKKLSGSVSPKRISALINLWGLALILPFGLWQVRSFDFSNVSTNTWLLLVFYSIAASVATVWLWMTGLKTVAAAQAGVFTVMLPVSAAFVGVVFLGETMQPIQILAFGIALLGVVLATWPSKLST